MMGLREETMTLARALATGARQVQEPLTVDQFEKNIETLNQRIITSIFDGIRRAMNQGDYRFTCKNTLGYEIEESIVAKLNELGWHARCGRYDDEITFYWQKEISWFAKHFSNWSPPKVSKEEKC